MSRTHLGKFLRERLGATFRLLKPIKAIQNQPAALLQRQYAAARYIEALDRGLRVICLDESVIKWTDHRKRGWVPKARRNQVTSNANTNGVNLIAAMCSSGEVCYTVNCGITNSETFCLFLVKLVEHLDGEDLRWREHSVIMLDNANYHRSVPTLRVMDDLRLPVLFLGPYHFRLAPVEMLFNYVKNRDLNLLHSKLRAW